MQQGDAAGGHAVDACQLQVERGGRRCEKRSLLNNAPGSTDEETSCPSGNKGQGELGHAGHPNPTLQTLGFSVLHLKPAPHKPEPTFLRGHGDNLHFVAQRCARLEEDQGHVVVLRCGVVVLVAHVLAHRVLRAPPPTRHPVLRVRACRSKAGRVEVERQGFERVVGAQDLGNGYEGRSDPKTF